MSRTFLLHSPLDDDELQFVSMTGNETLSHVSEFNVRAISLNPDIDATAMLGQNATIEVVTQEGYSRYLDGIVTQFTYVQPDSGASRQHIYHIKLQSWLALAALQMDSRVYQEISVPDIIKAALQEFGLPFEFKLMDSYGPRRFLVRYQESLLHFIMRLAEEVGIYFYTRHDLGQHTIIFTDGIHKTLPEYDTIEYLTPGTHPMEADEYIKEWQVQHEVQTGKYVTDSYNFQAPNANLSRNDQKQNNHAYDSLEVYDFHGGYLEHADDAQLAKNRLAQHQRNFLVINGETNVRGMAPGFYFSLVDHPSSAQNAEYLITSATYDFQENPLNSEQQKTTWNIAFSAKPSSIRFLPELKTPRPKIIGPQSARVTGPKGKDIWTDKWGRVILCLAAWKQVVPERDLNRGAFHMTGISGKQSANGFGANGIWELVAIPIVVSFDEDVPESHLEHVWVEVNGFGKRFGSHDELVLFPNMYSFDQLNTFDPEVLLSPTVAKPEALLPIGQGNLFWPQLAGIQHGLKLSTSFLRYFVGYRRAQTCGAESNGALCERLRRHVVAAICRRMGHSCEVTLSLDLYREALYLGLWRYQMSRLAKLSQYVVSEQSNKLHAGVGIRPDKQLSLRVGFFREKRLIGERDYLLLARPAENPSRCIERVRSKIEEAGIRTMLFNRDASSDSTIEIPI